MIKMRKINVLLLAAAPLLLTSCDRAKAMDVEAGRKLAKETVAEYEKQTYDIFHSITTIKTDLKKSTKSDDGKVNSEESTKGEQSMEIKVSVKDTKSPYLYVRRSVKLVNKNHDINKKLGTDEEETSKKSCVDEIFIYVKDGQQIMASNLNGEKTYISVKFIEQGESKLENDMLYLPTMDSFYENGKFQQVEDIDKVKQQLQTTLGSYGFKGVVELNYNDKYSSKGEGSLIVDTEYKISVEEKENENKFDATDKSSVEFLNNRIVKVSNDIDCSMIRVFGKDEDKATETLKYTSSANQDVDYDEFKIVTPDLKDYKLMTQPQGID